MGDRAAHVSKSEFNAQIVEAVAEFGKALAPRLRAGVGGPEDQLRGPLEILLKRPQGRLGSTSCRMVRQRSPASVCVPITSLTLLERKSGASRSRRLARVYRPIGGRTLTTERNGTSSRACRMCSTPMVNSGRFITQVSGLAQLRGSMATSLALGISCDRPMVSSRGCSASSCTGDPANREPSANWSALWLACAGYYVTRCSRSWSTSG